MGNLYYLGVGSWWVMYKSDDRPSVVERLIKYPQLHNDLPASRIEKVIVSPNQLFVLTKDGEIYNGLSAQMSKELGVGEKCKVTKLQKPALEDGS